jgi:hypothetical protein
VDVNVKNDQMPLKIHNEVGITDIVFLKTDPDQAMRIVTAIIIMQGTIKYRLAYDTEESEHYGYELTTTPNIIPDSASDTDS